MKPTIVHGNPHRAYHFLHRLQTLYYSINLNTRLSIIALTIGLLQCVLRIGAIGKYGFHQDELLYVALSEHLAWGYNETPPFIALVGKVSMLLFGNSLIAFRAIPSFCAVAIVYFTGRITARLNGGTLAVIFACTGVAFSSAFLATGAMFIPQVFDELCWILLAYVLILWTQEKKNKYLIFAGFLVGLGLYIKYTMLIYAAGMLAGLSILNPSIWKVKHLWYAIIIAIITFLPHVIWQFSQGFPALRHYNELKETQLIYLTRIDFVVQQLAVHGTGILIWGAGIVAFMKSKMLQPYQYMLIAFVFTMTVLLLLNGKSYYGFGAFPPLFAIGAIYLEKQWRASKGIKIATLAVLIVPNLLLAVIVLPHLPIEKAAKVFEWTYKNLNMHYPLKWEDQKIHNMNQNYADMIGWDELANKTARVYQSLSPDERGKTVIFASKYGEAGAIDYYKSHYKLPIVISFSSSYALWAPMRFDYQNIILITDTIDRNAIKGCKIAKYAEVKNIYSRIRGMDIYLIKDVNFTFRSWYLTKRLKIDSKRTAFISKMDRLLE